MRLEAFLSYPSSHAMGTIFYSEATFTFEKYGIGCCHKLYSTNTGQRICWLGYSVLKSRNNVGYPARIFSWHLFCCLLPINYQSQNSWLSFFVAVTPPVCINRMIARCDDKYLVHTHIYLHTCKRYICIHIQKSMFLSQLPLHDSKSVIRGGLAKTGQVKNVWLSGGSQDYLSPFSFPHLHLPFPGQPSLPTDSLAALRSTGW